MLVSGDARRREPPKGPGGVVLESNEPASLGSVLRELRTRAGLTREKLAERAGLSPQAVSALEQGTRRRPYPHTLAVLADALELSADDRTSLLQAAVPHPSEVKAAPVRWLPRPQTALIGREAELDALGEILQPVTGQERLVTLVGPGGVGKTRLALEVAAALEPRYEDGVVFVDLSPLRDPRLVPARIARVLELRESAGRSIHHVLLEYLRDRQILLVLDNFEHVVGAAAALGELLDACPRLALLVTSRTVLRLRLERRFPVEPLATPDPSVTENIEGVASSPAARLFVERAQTVSPEFGLTADNASAVIAVCRQLEGMPLAIELAAARVQLLSPEALLRRLEYRLPVLIGGPADMPARQQTLRNTLTWSYDLLAPSEQALLRRLAVFDGGWTLEAAEAVCASGSIDRDAILDLLGSLIDKSLVRGRRHGEPESRFRMLETIREYALELLGEPEESDVRRQHAAYCLALAETAEEELSGPDSPEWVARLEREHDNLRGALRWALATGQHDQGLRLAGAIWHFWWVRGRLWEGRRWLDELLQRSAADPASSAGVRAKALNAAGGLAFGQGDYEGARLRYEESLALGRARYDPRRIATALHNLGYLAAEQRDTPRAAALATECLTLARALGDARLIGVALTTLGDVTRQQGLLSRAGELLEEGVTILRREGYPLWEAAALCHLGNVMLQQHDWETAAAHYREGLRVCGELGDGYTLGSAKCVEGLAAVAAARSHATRAVRLLGAAAAVRETISAPLTPSARVTIEQVDAATRATLGDDRFGIAWQAGLGLTLAEATAIALEDGDEPRVASLETSSAPTVNSPVLPMNIGAPPVRSQMVPRQRLVDRLDGALTRAMVLVAAPAGYGKTAALVNWEARIDGRAQVAWLTLDEGDNDPARFWRYVLTALQTKQPGLATDLVARLQAGEPIGGVLDALLVDLAALEGHVVLVLDDYHVIHTPGIHAGVTHLLNRCPSYFHLVVSARSDPALPLARLRASGQLIEVRVADLRFTEVEAAALLGTVMGLDLSRDNVAALDARTEGWAAGLQLAALSLRKRGDITAAIATFAGSDRFVIDYFVEEVLTRLPDAEREFLERTSVLGRLNGALCDSVLGGQGSAAALEELERANVFVAPLDDERNWYRYHQLFADALRHRLQHSEPERMLELHGRASDWYAANGLLDEAVEHALAARRWDRAADLIGSAILSLLRLGEQRTIHRWMTQVPDEVCQKHPLLSGYRAATLLLAGEFHTLDAFLRGAEPALEAAGDERALGRVLTLHAQMAAIREDGDLAILCAQRALSLLPAGPTSHRTTALTAIIRVHLQRGDLPAAARVLDQALESTGSNVDHQAVWQLDNLLAQFSALQGTLQRAAVRYHELLESVGERTVFAVQVALIGLAGLAYEWDRLDQAADFLDRCDEARKRAGRPFPLPFPSILRARVARALGQPDAAREALQVAEDSARKFGSNRLRRLVGAERAWLSLMQGQLTTAISWADALVADIDGLETFPREPETLLLARVRRAQGAAADVVPMLERMAARAEQHGRGSSALAIHVQLALARHESGDQRRGLEALEYALKLAEPAGCVRVFADEGESLLPMLRKLMSSGQSAAYVARVLRATGGAGDHQQSAGEIMTPREVEVLHLLALGLSNRSIAERLITSEATVKSHVHRLISKLGVTSRAQVVVRAHQIGILDGSAGFTIPSNRGA